jgi:hypothetical protein
MRNSQRQAPLRNKKKSIKANLNMKEYIGYLMAKERTAKTGK